VDAGSGYAEADSELKPNAGESHRGAASKPLQYS